MRRVCITGSRNWEDRSVIYERLDELLDDYPDLEIAHGKSKGGGVDAFAESWANSRDVPQWPFPVRAGGTGVDGNYPYAPLKRNTRMLQSFDPDMVIGFRMPGKSNGTDHCLKEAERLGVKEIEIVHYEFT